MFPTSKHGKTWEKCKFPMFSWENVGKVAVFPQFPRLSPRGWGKLGGNVGKLPENSNSRVYLGKERENLESAGKLATKAGKVGGEVGKVFKKCRKRYKSNKN